MPELTSRHQPVLQSEAVSALCVRPGGRYVDATVGGGGHSFSVLEASAPDGRLLGLDCDPRAVALAGTRLAAYASRCILVRAPFARLKYVAQRNDFAPCDGVLLDLGMSSDQLDDPQRGFSFQAEGPLDMRLDPDGATTAGDLVNGLGEPELADLIHAYGEERRSRRVARAIVRARPISTTTELAAIVARAVGARAGGVHPATRTFQALRIAVNDELRALEAVLPQAIELLVPHGRLVVISFHSLEDRIVKRAFVREARDCVCPPALPECRCAHRARLRLVTRRPLRPTEAERSANSRARSARLRAAERIADTAAEAGG